MKKILFLTGTRADFGKIKSLISILESDADFEVYVFVTGMHMRAMYGSTYIEVEKCGFRNVFKFINSTSESTMDLTLAKTIEGLSSYIKENPVDMIVIHGDRVEALAGAIVGALNNILVAHIEGGELSGTIDDLIRHSVSKLSHLHFVSNEQAKHRLEQMGEIPDHIFNIGSPDMDIMFSNHLPSLKESRAYYDIKFDHYAIVMYHPVTTEYEDAEQHAKDFFSAIRSSGDNYVIVYPNNDLGCSYILSEIKRLQTAPFVNARPSFRFEYFLTLLNNADYIIGNSSAGIREAPAYGVPTVNVGTRQNNRATAPSIVNCSYSTADILNAIEKCKSLHCERKRMFGKGNSRELFHEVLKRPEIWEIDNQKQFVDIDI